MTSERSKFEVSQQIVREASEIWAVGDNAASHSGQESRTWALSTRGSSNSAGCVSISMPRLPVEGLTAWMGRRLYWWPAGLPHRRRLAIVSSRLKKRKDLQSWWFDALRTAVLRCHPDNDSLWVVDGTASAASVTRASELFGIHRHRICISDAVVDSADELAEWLNRIAASDGDSSSTGKFESMVFASPRFVPQNRSDEQLSKAPEAQNDTALVAIAEKIVSLYCRSNGTVERLLTRRLRDDWRQDSLVVTVTMANSPPIPQSIIERGAVEWILDGPPITAGVAEPTSADEESSNAVHGPLAAPDEWLCHWTRPAFGPWPGQSTDDYLDELILGCDSADRSALACLLRIVVQRQILATVSARHEPPTVSLTAVPLADFRRRRVFRSHRQRYDFESWGVAIRRTVVKRLGGQPVEYVTPGKAPLSSANRFTQVRFDAQQRIDWSEEREWRVARDIDLTLLDHHDVCLFVNERAEAAVVRDQCPWTVVVVPQ